MLNKLLSVMVFMAWLVCPAVIAQAPHLHAFVDPVNQSVNTINVSWFVETGELLMSTAISRAPMMEFNWNEEDGTHNTLTTEVSNTKEWVFEITSITGLGAFENGKIVPQGQGQGPAQSSYTTSWVDSNGSTWTVLTLRTSTTAAGRKEELRNHLEQVREMQSAFPPRPVTPPPEPEPEEAFLSPPPRWHRSEVRLALV
ncbi:MAG: hypothetical protein AAB534_02865 [Patescibacteria group bacterium]